MELTENERAYTEVLLNHGKHKIFKYITDTGESLRDRLIVYLGTPAKYYNGVGSIPEFPEFESKYGKIDWKESFPFLLRDQTVNLVKFCKYAINGNYTYFPEGWSQRTIFDFVIECVNLGIHEFDYYW